MSMFFEDVEYLHYIVWILSTIVVFAIGLEFHKNAIRQLRNRSSNMDTLVSISTSIAYFFSLFNLFFPQFWLSRGMQPHLYFEASSVIITFILLGRMLEQRAKQNTSAAIKNLIGLQPKNVSVIRDGREQTVPVNKVNRGDVVLVKPGDRISVDGTISYGETYIDESMLSGEAVEVYKTVGDKVFAGTINRQGAIRFVADKTSSQTVLAQIIRMVKEAQGSKAPIQKTVDKIAGIFVPTIITISIVTFILWIVFSQNYGFENGLRAMITVLIIACPCALGLATPTAIIVGIGKGAENGILIKDAESLEIAKKIDAILLDKTGTITEGKPKVCDMEWASNEKAEIQILYSLELLSDHPLAKAVTNVFEDEREVEVSQFENISGKGIKGLVNNVWYFVGNESLIRENNIEIDDNLRQKAEIWEAQSKTVIWFAGGEKTIAVISISDTIKPSSEMAIGRLKKMGMDLYVISGDNYNSTREIATRVGIENFHSNVLPIDKAMFVKKMQQQGKIVAMVGDGINDSAAMAQADISIAMGKGSDIAINTATVTILSSDLDKIAEMIKLSRHTTRTINENLFWAFIYNIIGVPLAAGILYSVNGFMLNPMVASMAMVCSSISVVLNSLRLKSKRL